MRRVLLSLSVSLMLISVSHAQKVVTVAGGYIGDHKLAPQASFAFPTGLAFDNSGNLYVADSNHCLIRVVGTKGTINTFAGNGLCGYSGDGGRATAARFSTVYALAFDAQGNLLVADAGNSRIRKITASGMVTTVAGNGTFGYSGDGGPATQASLGFARGIAVDAAGNIYIADSNNNVVRLVDTAGIIRTVAGNHSFGYSGDGGPATAAQMQNTNAVAVDGNGDFYIAE